jgi:2-oxoglutarate ferredoxin oxidoreductase subunit alpha
VPADQFAAEKGVKRSFGNNVFIGVILRCFGVGWRFGWKVLSKQFAKSDGTAIQEALKKGYNLRQQQDFAFSPRPRNLRLATGNQAAAQAAAKSGLELCFAYPITPATGFVEELRRNDQVVIHQPEDEIAAINNSLGAAFAGAMTAVATSGEGAALMAESFSLAAMAEVPLVLYWAERLGPSTGVPTYTSQGDLKFALNIGHGEFPRVVVAPGDANEAYGRTAEAFYLAYKYRLPVVILTDKHLAESYYNFAPSPFSVKPDKFLAKSKAGYRSYAITSNGVSPRLAPGQSQITRATSYEHDEFGLTTEDPKMIVAMNEKRWRKERFLKQEIAKLEPCRVYGKGERLLVGWGSVKGAAIDALKELSGYSFLQISYIAPFPADKVGKLLREAKQATLIENDFTGLLGQVIRENTGIEIKNKLLKNDGRPFTAEEIIKRLKK